MNAKETKELIRLICPDLELSGHYSQIMPRITANQLDKLLDVAEQGENTETWSHLAMKFFECGQQALVAANIGRLVERVTGGDAGWLLRYAHLTDEHRTALVECVTDSWDAARALRYAPSLTDKHRAALAERVTDSNHARWLLCYSPG